MPNGISCACFAIRNHKAAETTNNAFREGIAAIQTVRTLDAAAQANVVQKSAIQPVLPHLNKAAMFLKKLVYPLIIGSAVYNTAKSDDKVKTGCSQAAGIGAMYAFEKVAQKNLEKIDDKIAKSSIVTGSKYGKVIKALWYVGKGLLYLTASLGGYKTASEFVSAMIDKIRGKKGTETINPTEQIKEKSKVFNKFV